MIIKCSTCQAPMTESIKNRPANLPENIKWIVCRDCGLGVEMVGDVEPVGEVKEMRFEETVTIKQYVTIRKSKDGVIKYKYTDPERTNLIGEEKIG